MREKAGAPDVTIVALPWQGGSGLCGTAYSPPVPNDLALTLETATNPVARLLFPRADRQQFPQMQSLQLLRACGSGVTKMIAWTKLPYLPDGEEWLAPHGMAN